MVKPNWPLTPDTKWKKDKGLGSWSFAKDPSWSSKSDPFALDKGKWPTMEDPWTADHHDELSYNEGDHIANSSNAVWLMTEGTNEPITPTHDPCGYWYKEVAWTPPLSCLWAWFKFNEGAGCLVRDYGPSGVGDLFVGGTNTPACDCSHLTADQIANFWSIAGFAHNDYNDPPTVFGSSRYNTVCHSAPERPSRYCSALAFIRPLAGWDITYIQLGHTADFNGFNVGRGEVGANQNKWKFVSFEGFSGYSTVDIIDNIWYCIYAYSSGPSDLGEAKLYVRSSGGAFTEVVGGATTVDKQGNQDAILIGGHTTTNSSMDWGDALFYACGGPSGLITLADANAFYELLKSRYGMA